MLIFYRDKHGRLCREETEPEPEPDRHSTEEQRAYWRERRGRWRERQRVQRRGNGSSSEVQAYRI